MHVCMFLFFTGLLSLSDIFLPNVRLWSLIQMMKLYYLTQKWQPLLSMVCKCNFISVIDSYYHMHIHIVTDFACTLKFSKLIVKIKK